MKFTAIAFGVFAAFGLVATSGASAADRSAWHLSQETGVFEAAVERAGLPWPPADKQAFTLFLPSDAALEAEHMAGLLEGVYASPSNRERLVDLLDYHIVPGEKLTLESDGMALAVARSGEALLIERRGGATTVNRHIRVLESVDLGEAVVHLVSGLLWADLVYDRGPLEYLAQLEAKALD